MIFRHLPLSNAATYLGAVAVLLPTIPVQAEVSLVPARPGREAQVDVRSTPDGPWSTRDLPSELTLNPSGDLLGDGHPGTAVRNGWACAAWHRPAENSVEVAIGTEAGWAPGPSLPCASVIGVPRVATLENGSVLLGWTNRGNEGGLHAQLALTQGDDETLLEPLDGDSVVVGASELGSQAALLTLVEQGYGSFELVLAFPIKPPNEPPRFQLVSLGWVMSSGGSALETALAADPLIQPVSGEEGIIGLVTWRNEEGGLSYVLLEEHGVASGERRLPGRQAASASAHARLRQVLKAEGLQGRH